MAGIEGFVLEEQRHRHLVTSACGEERRGFRPAHPGDHDRLSEIREGTPESGGGVYLERRADPAGVQVSVQRPAHLRVKGSHEDVHNP
jgi:hypothetical protein